MQVRPPLSTLLILALTVPAVCDPANASAQGVVIDEGAFDISIGGRPAGTETFAIRRSSAGPNAQIIATAEISISTPEGLLEHRPALQVVGSVMTVAAYQTKVSGARDEEVFVTAGIDRFLLRMRSSRGEQERELRAAPGTLVLDADVAHQHYFLSQLLLTGNQSLPVIVPREGRQVQVTVVDSSQESIQIAGQAVDSHHFRLSLGPDVRELWVDADGRVLRVVVSSAGYDAIRTAAPAARP